MPARGASLMSLPDRVRLPLAFDPGPLAADLDRFPAGAWTSHFVRANYEGDWSALPLRAPAGETHPKRQIYAGSDVRHFVDTVFLERAPNIARALAQFSCSLWSVRLMRLGPGSIIREHEDPDLDAALGRARLHVPITHGAGVEFRLNGEPVAMAPGSVWYLRLSDPHSARNRGPADRIHLVIDAKVDAWLARMLRVGAAGDG